MNIKILDSWLRDYLKTDATPQKIGEVMSLTSVSIERIEKYNDDYTYDIEITTNRPDLLSVVGLAREAATVLQQNGIKATFQPPLFKTPSENKEKMIKIVSDDSLVYRICAVVMDVSVKETPPHIKERLETSGIRSLNNLIDVTNYVMRTIGHPTHVFDYDRLNTNTLVIRAAKKGETITTLDHKTYTLPGGDIIAENDRGEIVDLLGVMGLANSVVTNETKRILFFIDNNDPMKMRKTSMELALRSEAVQINEKHIDPELAMDALLYGISLYKEVADAHIVSEIIDIYPQPKPEKKVIVTEEQINTVIGVSIPIKQSADILKNLGFTVVIEGKNIKATVPSFRAKDIDIPEDLIEEIARIYGYHKIPSALPPLSVQNIAQYTNDFYWEKRIKDALKYWGFTEVYTYSMVSENLFEGELSEAVTIQNPLAEDMVYMRRTLIPSLLLVVGENKSREDIKIFELSNIYEKRDSILPDERLHLAGIIKKPHISFFEVKGIFEQLAKDLEITHLLFKPVDNGSSGAEIYIESEKIGDIEILDKEVIDFEIDFGSLIKYATAKKTFIPLAKYPPIIEDMTFIISDTVTVGEIINSIKKQSELIRNVSLFDRYKDTRTFRITYQHAEKNLTTADVAPVREKISKTLKETLHLQIK